jgi:hypothetical protein
MTSSSALLRYRRRLDGVAWNVTRTSSSGPTGPADAPLTTETAAPAPEDRHTASAPPTMAAIRSCKMQVRVPYCGPWISVSTLNDP